MRLRNNNAKFLPANCRFYFPGGKPLPLSQVEATISRITAAFQGLPGHRASRAQFHSITKVRPPRSDSFTFPRIRFSIISLSHSQRGVSRLILTIPVISHVGSDLTWESRNTPFVRLLEQLHTKAMICLAGMRLAAVLEGAAFPRGRRRSGRLR